MQQPAVDPGGLGLARMRDETDIAFAVENMYPWRARSREWAAYQPDWDPRNQDYPKVTLDLLHTAVSGTSAVSMARDLGDRLAHLHLADGTGLARDRGQLGVVAVAAGGSSPIPRSHLVTGHVFVGTK